MFDTARVIPNRVNVDAHVREAVPLADYVKHTPTSKAGNAQHWRAGAQAKYLLAKTSGGDGSMRDGEYEDG